MNDSPTAPEASPYFAADLLDYDLPQALIAQQPPARRDGARLLVFDRPDQRMTDRAITDLPDLLRADDLLVLNDTKVLPARFSARRATGGLVRALFEREIEPGAWVVMLEASRRLRVGESLTAVANDDQVDTDDNNGGGAPIRLRMSERIDPARWRVRVDPPQSAEALLARIGRTPLPPYIHRDGGRYERVATANESEDQARYQTVFARRPGAVAAPTAGLHLTLELLDRLRRAGVATTTVTLHVGPGTFLPIRVDDLAEHHMHAEWFEVSEEAARAVADCRARGGRVVAVGTTSVRVLESAVDSPDPRTVRVGSGWTDLFLYPPRELRVVDALLTNFHLPRSTLLALVMSFAGVEAVRRVYRHAIDQRYRFYSYGDAMLIL